MKPQFSICIPAYNAVTAFARCLESVLGQSEHSLECLVHDDSTTSDIAAYLQGIADPRIRYMRNAPRLGAPQNWNAALAQAEGDIVTLLHQDDWYRFPDTLQRIREAMEAPHADVLITGRALYEHGTCLGEYTATARHQNNFAKDFPGKSLVVNRLGHPSVFFFRNHLKHILYNEQLCYFADTEYYMRLFTAAGNVAPLALPLVALERKGDNQLSSVCLSKPEAVVDELQTILNMHSPGVWARALANGRFFTSHLRHWRPRGAARLLGHMAQKLQSRIFLLMLATIPIFSLHMLYRRAYRYCAEKPWG